LHDGVALLTLDNPPVNQMSPQLMQDFGAAIGEAMQDEAVKAIVLTGTGKNFIAGADITRLQLVKKKEDIHGPALEAARFLNGIEMAPKPIIAAINGNCLGGGLETAMACHYRIAAPGINLGQPEVQIGLIPGAGGTQRLPRLIGLPNAVEMITTGAPIKAEKALQRGLVDEVVPQEKLVEAGPGTRSTDFPARRRKRLSSTTSR
jgi:enoyl-CoA hydratase/carnithine racemase